MNKTMSLGIVIVALVIGFGLGFFVERNRATVKMESYKMLAQRQMDEIKMMAEDKAKSVQTALMQTSPIKMSKDAKLGTIVTAENGMTLYTYDKDSKNDSYCTGACAAKWPPYTVTGAVPTNLPAHLGTFKNDSGATQYAWDGKPLYFYSTDKNVGDVTGDGVGGVWHVAK